MNRQPVRFRRQVTGVAGAPGVQVRRSFHLSSDDLIRWSEMNNLSGCLKFITYKRWRM